MPRHTLSLPDLGLPDTPVRAGAWRVGEGRWVSVGDPLLEVMAGEVLVELPAAASGRLVERCVHEDDPLHVGQVLAVIDSP